MMRRAPHGALEMAQVCLRLQLWPPETQKEPFWSIHEF